VKIGISGAVGIGKSYFINSLDNAIFLAVEEAARQVNAMYPDKDVNDLREIIFQHQISVETVVDNIAENVIAVCDRTLIDNIIFLEIFDNQDIANEKKAVLKSAYDRGLKRYNELYYFDYGKYIDPIMLKTALSDSFRKKTLGELASVEKFLEFNKKFKDKFLQTAEEFNYSVKVIKTDYEEYSLQERNKTLSKRLINNFLGV